MWYVVNSELVAITVPTTFPWQVGRFYSLYDEQPKRKCYKCKAFFFFFAEDFPLMPLCLCQLPILRASLCACFPAWGGFAFLPDTIFQKPVINTLFCKHPWFCHPKTTRFWICLCIFRPYFVSNQKLYLSRFHEKKRISFLLFLSFILGNCAGSPQVNLLSEYGRASYSLF